MVELDERLVNSEMLKPAQKQTANSKADAAMLEKLLLLRMLVSPQKQKEANAQVRGMGIASIDF